MTANWRNRTIWTGDNLSVMRGMNSAKGDGTMAEMLAKLSA